MLVGRVGCEAGWQVPGIDRMTMPNTLKWTDAEDLAIRLHERFPELDPLTVRFTDLHRWVCELDEFGDDPNNSSEAKLEAIQMAWWEEKVSG